MHRHLSRVLRVFDAVRGRGGRDRSAMIREMGEGSDTVEREVRSLLAHDSPTGEFLGRPFRQVTQALHDAPEELPPPERIGPYRVERVLGRGGFGVVYLAEQSRPRRRVAVKVLRPLYSTDDLRRFELEADTLARLDHSGIARIFELGVWADGGGMPYLVMEYIAGLRLDVYAARGGLSQAARIELLIRISDAIAYAHQQGVIHRDLAPKNILVDPSGSPRVLDFGLARWIRERPANAASVTQAGALVGTVRYMSPEQLRHGWAADTRSDVYSLGVIAYELLTGRHPYFDGPGVGADLMPLLSDEPARRPSSLAAEVRGDIELVLMKAVAADPSMRYQTADVLGADLRRVLGGEPISARPPSIGYILRRFVGRHRAAVSGSVVGLILLMLAGVQWIGALRGEADAQQATLSALDSVVSGVLSPLSPVVGTVETRAALLTAIGPNVESVAASLPDDPTANRILARYLAAAGDLAMERGDVVAAHGVRRRAFDVYERIWNQGDPSEAIGHEYSIAMVKYGDTFEHLGDVESATRIYRDAHSFQEALIRRFEHSAALWSLLAWSYRRLAEYTPVQEVERLRSLHRGLEQCTQVLARLQPDGVFYLEAFIEERRLLGKIAGLQDDAVARAQHLSIALAAARELVARYPAVRAYAAGVIELALAHLDSRLDAGTDATVAAALAEARDCYHLFGRSDPDAQVLERVQRWMLVMEEACRRAGITAEKSTDLAPPPTGSVQAEPAPPIGP